MNYNTQEIPENGTIIEDTGGNSDEESCPECGSYPLLKEGRCTTCLNCFWSKCSI